MSVGLPTDQKGKIEMMLTVDTVSRIREFLDANLSKGFDNYGRGWGRRDAREVTANLAIQTDLSCDAFDANLILEEAMMDYQRNGNFYIGAHRATETLGWQHGFSTYEDSLNRVKINKIYAENYFQD